MTDLSLLALGLLLQAPRAPGSPPFRGTPTRFQAPSQPQGLLLPDTIFRASTSVLVAGTSIRIPPPPADSLSAFQDISRIRTECSHALGYLAAEIARFESEQREALEMAHRDPEYAAMGTDTEAFRGLKALLDSSGLEQASLRLRETLRMGQRLEQGAAKAGLDLAQFLERLADRERRAAEDRRTGSDLPTSEVTPLPDIPRVNSGMQDAGNRLLLRTYGQAWEAFSLDLNQHIGQLVQQLDPLQADPELKDLPSLNLVSRALKLRLLRTYQDQTRLHYALWEQAAAIGEGRNSALYPQDFDQPLGNHKW